MRRVHTRWAMLLAATAVLIPCVVWYWLGTRQLEREAEQLVEGAKREAASAAEQMAAQLAIRLEELIDHETNRPYFHYWREYLSRGESCADLKVRKSPLARGKRHKMILAHFQIDDNGRITSAEPWAKVDTVEFSDPTAGGRIGRKLGSLGHRSPIHAAIMSPASVSTPLERPAADETAEVTPFRWQTGSFRGDPMLMALRQVMTSGQPFVQGFVVDGAGLSHWLFEHDYKADFRPGEPQDDTSARVPILGATWHVQVDPEARLERARGRAAALSQQFHTSYLGGMFGALLAAACLVVVIRRSERLAEERSRFAAAAAHELRTPLAGIRLHGEMLALALGNPGRVQEYAGRITDEAERLTRLVSNVFNYTQTDQKRLRIKKELGDIGAAVRRALEVMEPIVARLGGRLIVRVQDGLPPAEFDSDAIHQMVRNLVDNAEKYTRSSADRRIEVDVAAKVGWIEISVRDHGDGVPAGQRSRIFQAFSRHADDTETGGLGLGLSVVKTLITAHGGRVEVRDAPGGGACFVLRLPIDPGI